MGTCSRAVSGRRAAPHVGARRFRTRGSRRTEDITVLAWIAVLQSDGLGLREIFAEIPHDPPAVVVYSLIVLSGWAIWRGSRKGRGQDGS